MAKSTVSYMRDFSTNAKYTINNWASFAQLVKKYGSLAKKKNPGVLIESVVLEDAFNGGFSFCLRDVARLLVKIDQVMILVRQGKEDADSLTPDVLAQFHCEKIAVTRLVPAKVEKVGKKILSETAKFDKALQQLHAAACEAVVTHLKKVGIDVNASERDELTFIESRRGLVRRLDALSLQGLKNDEVLSLEQYFRYKTAIVIKNAMSRSQKSPSNSEVDQRVKKIKSCFETIRKDKEQFIKQRIAPLEKQLQDVLTVAE